MAFSFNSDEYIFSDRSLTLPTIHVLISDQPLPQIRMIPIPRLVPNRPVSLCAEIRCVNPEKQLAEEEVRMILCRTDWTRPVWSASFQMPISEPEIS